MGTFAKSFGSWDSQARTHRKWLQLNRLSWGATPTVDVTTKGKEIRKNVVEDAGSLSSAVKSSLRHSYNVFKCFFQSSDIYANSLFFKSNLMWFQTRPHIRLGEKNSLPICWSPKPSPDSSSAKISVCLRQEKTLFMWMSLHSQSCPKSNKVIKSRMLVLYYHYMCVFLISVLIIKCNSLRGVNQ